MVDEEFFPIPPQIPPWYPPVPCIVPVLIHFSTVTDESLPKLAAIPPWYPPAPCIVPMLIHLVIDALPAIIPQIPPFTVPLLNVFPLLTQLSIIFPKNWPTIPPL